MKSQVIARPVTDGFGGKVWWAVSFNSWGMTVSECGFYGIQGVPAECQSSRVERFVFSQPALEPESWPEGM